MEDLRKLGLNRYEVRIFVALLQHGMLPARRIAELSGVPVTAVYPNVQHLVGQGLVQVLDGKIREYEALRPSVCIPALIERRQRELASVREYVNELENMLGSKQIEKVPDALHVSFGLLPSQQFVHDSIDYARKSFYVMGWRFRKVKDKYVLLRKLIAAKERGVDVRIILASGEKDSQLVSAYEKQVPVRFSASDNFSVTVVDGKECKITLKSKKLPDRLNVVFRDQDLAKAMHEYFLTVWEKARLHHNA